ncbi:MAG: lytic transglycosylase domain-containing protein [bacterium]
MFKKRIKAIALGAALFWASDTVIATNLEFPITFNTEYLTRLLKETVFHDVDSLSVWGDESGCNDLTLQNPTVLTEGDKLYVLSDVTVLTGWVIGGRCISLVNWQGMVKALQRTDVIDSRGLISFSTVDTELLDPQGERAQVSNAIWKLAKDNVHTQLDKLSINLIPAMDEIRELLPTFLATDSLDRAEKVVNSFHIESLQTESQQLSAVVNFSIDTLPREVKPLPQTTLTQSELELFEETWERWDAFLGFVIKIAGRNTLTDDQINRLLETLIDTRYSLLDVLTDRNQGGSTPVRENFIRVWQQLAPIFRELSMDIQGTESLRFLSFIAAVDALETLDTLGPVTGWDITIDGLRRLARLLIEDSSIDPLEIKPNADSELRQVFDFGPVLELPPAQGIPDPESSLINWLDWLSQAALANIRSDQDAKALNEMVPNRENIDQYLLRVEELLRNTSYGTLLVNPLSREYHTLFHNLIFTTAWQETCWRQYKHRRGKLRPVTSSAGALGMMQIMPIVWRGFYDTEALGNSIEYNAAAGSEILHRYLVRYALRKGEHQQKGGVDNLVRATYAAYNGGPRHLSRYRKSSTSESLKKIDTAFWQKFLQVRNSGAGSVKQCYPYG